MYYVNIYDEFQQGNFVFIMTEMRDSWYFFEIFYTNNKPHRITTTVTALKKVISRSSAHLEYPLSKYLHYNRCVSCLES